MRNLAGEIAHEWARREYYRLRTSGALNAEQSLEAFTEANWARALHEGDVRYRQARGENVDGVAALADFKARQERQAAVLLEKAKAELRGVLDEDDDEPPAPAAPPAGRADEDSDSDED